MLGRYTITNDSSPGIAMVNVEAIHRDIKQAPTVMDLEVEIEFCRRLIELSPEDFAAHSTLCLDILERLDISHSDTFYAVTSLDQLAFYVNWARSLAESPACTEYKWSLLDTADMFSVLPP
jgi:hypothetical protein